MVHRAMEVSLTQCPSLLVDSRPDGAYRLSPKNPLLDFEPESIKKPLKALKEAVELQSWASTEDTPTENSDHTLKGITCLQAANLFSNSVY